MPKKLTQAIVWEWILTTSGWVSNRELDEELEITSSEGKASRRTILSRFTNDGRIERHLSKIGVFRRVEQEATLIEWQKANPESSLNIVWPFGLEKLVRIYPKNLIVLAGAPNAGKTGFCIDFIIKNQKKHFIVYYSSEMGAEEMKVRFNKTGETEWFFEARERSSHFRDVIQPDKINIIDYLEIGDNFYLVGDELRAIWEKLNQGIALVILQKKRGAELGRGAEFSLEKPRLYLSMDNNELKIIKAKNWAVEGTNPNGMKWTFQLIDGCKFINTKEAL